MEDVLNVEKGVILQENVDLVKTTEGKTIIEIIIAIEVDQEVDQDIINMKIVDITKIENSIFLYKLFKLLKSR